MHGKDSGNRMKKKEILDALMKRHPALEKERMMILQAEQVLEECFEAGGKLLICGNGGSAADSEHIAGELMKNFKTRRALSAEDRQKLDAVDESGCLAKELMPALPAIALSAQTALSTAILNDCEASVVFAQQVWGYGKAEDCLLALSTSGNSENVYMAVLAAKARGMKTILLTGAGNGKICPLVDVCVSLPEKETDYVQELTMPVYHTICIMLEEHFWGKRETLAAEGV